METIVGLCHRRGQQKTTGGSGVGSFYNGIQRHKKKARAMRAF
jgi:hypothetical protein